MKTSACINRIYPSFPFISLSVCLFVCLSLSLSLCLCLSVSPCLCLSVCLCLSLSLSLALSLPLSLYPLSLSLSSVPVSCLCLSVCLTLSQSVRLSHCREEWQTDKSDRNEDRLKRESDKETRREVCGGVGGGGESGNTKVTERQSHTDRQTD